MQAILIQYKAHKIMFDNNFSRIIIFLNYSEKTRKYSVFIRVLWK